MFDKFLGLLKVWKITYNIQNFPKTIFKENNFTKNTSHKNSVKEKTQIGP